jgi:putative addiction module component
MDTHAQLFYAVDPSGAATMSDRAKALGERARELSPPERIALVEDVLDSLDRTDPRVDRLWATEAKDRLAAYPPR